MIDVASIDSGTARYLVGDTRTLIEEVPDDSIDLLLTSPPFLRLRAYLPKDHEAKGSEIGSEPTPLEFLEGLLELTAEWRRVLTERGSLCVELGDTYSGSGGAGGDYNEGGLRDGQPAFAGSGRVYGNGRGPRPERSTRGLTDEEARLGFDPKRKGVHAIGTGGEGWPEKKSLCMIPQLYATALAYGINPLTGAPSPAGRWRVRNIVRWARPNPSVGQLFDKFRPATSEMIVATVSRERYFDGDAVRQQASPGTNPRTKKGVASRENTTAKASAGGNNNRDKLAIEHSHATAPPKDWWDEVESVFNLYLRRAAKDGKRPTGGHAVQALVDAGVFDEGDLWRIPPGGYRGAHYAVFPRELCVLPIRAMCPQSVCTTCGKPRERIVQRVNALGYATGQRTWAAGAGGRPRDIPDRNTDAPDAAERVTIGWTDCGHDTWRPGVVLDPFAGSATALEVAVDQGRAALGFDLDPRNLDLARSRLGLTLETS